MEQTQKFNGTLRHGYYAEGDKQVKGWYLEISLTDKYKKNWGIAADMAGLLKHQNKDVLEGFLVTGKSSNGEWTGIDFRFHEKLKKRCFLSDSEVIMIEEPAEGGAE